MEFDFDASRDTAGSVAREMVSDLALDDADLEPVRCLLLVHTCQPGASAPGAAGSDAEQAACERRSSSGRRAVSFVISSQ